MKGAWEITRVANIPIKIHWSFWLLFLWLPATVWLQGLDLHYLLVSFLLLLTVFCCVVLHEYGHALVARRFGIKTLDIVLTPIGGIARLVSMPAKPKQELIIALAGPLVNIMIALVVGFFLAFLLRRPLLYPGVVSPMDSTASFIHTIFYLNIILAIFNLIPAFPMDGGRVLRALLAFRFTYQKATKIATAIGKIFAVLFIGAGIYLQNYVLSLIGLFVFFGANRASRLSHFSAESGIVADAMRKDHCKIFLGDTKREIKDKLEAFPNQLEFFVFNSASQLLGGINKNDLGLFIQDSEVNFLKQDALHQKFEVFPVNYPLANAREIMKSKGYTSVPVYSEQRLIGVLETH